MLGSNPGVPRRSVSPRGVPIAPRPRASERDRIRGHLGAIPRIHLSASGSTRAEHLLETERRWHGPRRADDITRGAPSHARETARQGGGEGRAARRNGQPRGEGAGRRRKSKLTRPDSSWRVTSATPPPPPGTPPRGRGGDAALSLESSHFSGPFQKLSRGRRVPLPGPDVNRLVVQRPGLRWVVSRLKGQRTRAGEAGPLGHVDRTDPPKARGAARAAQKALVGGAARRGDPAHNRRRA